MSDHGPGAPAEVKGFEDRAIIRSQILNAVYSPDSDIGFYHSMTPVNVFRLIFNGYFDTNYEILEDESYFTSSYEKPFSLIRVTEFAR